MNILIPDSWLREHLKTKAKPAKIAQCLSLCGQSVEKVIKKDSNLVYDIEITSNRPDCLSIYGIARELAAILPRFGIPAQLKPVPEEKLKIPSVSRPLPLKVEIKKSSLCPRFTAMIFENVSLKESPKIIQERLEKSGLRGLDNVVDVSNYLMLELGQPIHTFDYDKIRGRKMILRESREGEEIITLDGVCRKLPPGAIIIEDGEGRVIDLCGIMGGQNSSVDKNTKRVLLFVQIYDPLKIRQTCQKLGFRTEASSRFERGVDPEGIILTIKKATRMLAENARAKVASNLIDIYPSPLKTKTVYLSQKKLDQIIGVEIKLVEARKILESLGFRVALDQNQAGLTAIVPRWRNSDVSIPEDLVEEVARIYGYFNLPSLLPTGDFPEKSFGKIFYWEEKIKDFLKYQGFTEVYTYSMVPANLLLIPEIGLKIKNPLTKEWEYLRTSLIPSILQVVADNQERFEEIKIFEMANQYLPRTNQLPEETLTLIGAVTGKDKFRKVKGMIEILLEELGIQDYLVWSGEIQPRSFWYPKRTTELIVKGKASLGYLGEIHPEIIANFGIDKKVTAFQLNIPWLTKLASRKKSVVPVPKYPSIVEDLALIVPPKTYLSPILKAIKKVSSLIQSVEFVDSFKQTRTLRVTYQHLQRNLTTKEVEKIKKKINQELEKKFNTTLKE